MIIITEQKEYALVDVKQELKKRMLKLLKDAGFTQKVIDSRIKAHMEYETAYNDDRIIVITEGTERGIQEFDINSFEFKKVQDIPLPSGKTVVFSKAVELLKEDLLNGVFSKGTSKFLYYHKTKDDAFYSILATNKESDLEDYLRNFLNEKTLKMFLSDFNALYNISFIIQLNRGDGNLIRFTTTENSSISATKTFLYKDDNCMLQKLLEKYLFIFNDDEINIIKNGLLNYVQTGLLIPFKHYYDGNNNLRLILSVDGKEIPFSRVTKKYDYYNYNVKEEQWISDSPIPLNKELLESIFLNNKLFLDGSYHTYDINAGDVWYSFPKPSTHRAENDVLKSYYPVCQFFYTFKSDTIKRDSIEYPVKAYVRVTIDNFFKVTYC